MTRTQITETLIEAIELLQKAKPGNGPSEQRIKCREQACERLATLPSSWWRRVDADLVGAFQDAER